VINDESLVLRTYKFYPATCTGNFLPSWTPALERGGWSAPHPSRFTPKKRSRYPLFRKLGGPGNVSPPPLFWCHEGRYTLL